MAIQKYLNDYTKVFLLSLFSIGLSFYMLTSDINNIGWYVFIVLNASIFLIGYILKGKWYIFPIFYTLGILVGYIISSLYIYTLDGTFEEGTWTIGIINVFLTTIYSFIIIGLGRLGFNIKNKYSKNKDTIQNPPS